MKEKINNRCKKIMEVLDTPKTAVEITKCLEGKNTFYQDFINKMFRVRYALKLLVEQGKVTVQEEESERSPYKKKVYSRVI